MIARMLASRAALLTVPFLTVGISPAAEPSRPTLSIDWNSPAGQVSPLHYGLMTEEVNYCYDGGLYAELLRNRSFQDDKDQPVHWSPFQTGNSGANISLDPGQPFHDGSPVSLRVDVTAAWPGSPAGTSNGGFWGIPVKPDTRYRATLHAKAIRDFTTPLTLSIVSTDGSTVYATGTIPRLSSEWTEYHVELNTRQAQPTSQAKLVISADQPGTFWLGMASLFPPTWNERPNGLRPDLMQMLVDLKPAFLRFPGGNYLEGTTLETRFDWKKTLGPISRRPGHQGTWGYRSSDGMGLMEFLLWCEDMGAKPVLGLYAGYSLNGSHVPPGPDLEPYIQDALEEIEYVAGPASSPWGARRAKDGHPDPFPLTYVEIGNEDWFDKSGSYDARFTQFRDAIKKAWPNLQCISTIGTEQPAQKRVKSSKPDVLDEHYYLNTKTFLEKSPTHFDSYDRKGPRIFVGEWAAHETAFPPWDKRSKGLPATPTLKAAIGDAAWMAAMERNSDLVTMQCYAPLFANVNDYQWRPDLIGYDALRAYGSPSYYALRMFSTHVGDRILPAKFSNCALQGSVTRSMTSGITHIKIVNPGTAPVNLDIILKGTTSVLAQAHVQTLSGSPDHTNSIEQPEKVIPVDSRLDHASHEFAHTIPACSITVLQVKAH